MASSTKKKQRVSQATSKPVPKISRPASKASKATAKAADGHVSTDKVHKSSEKTDKPIVPSLNARNLAALQKVEHKKLVDECQRWKAEVAKKSSGPKVNMKPKPKSLKIEDYPNNHGREDVFADESEGYGRTDDSEDTLVVLCRDHKFTDISNAYLEADGAFELKNNNQLSIKRLPGRAFSLLLRYLQAPDDIPDDISLKDLLALACAAQDLDSKKLLKAVLRRLKQVLEDGVVLRLRAVHYVYSYTCTKGSKQRVTGSDIRELVSQAFHFVLSKNCSKPEHWSRILAQVRPTPGEKRDMLRDLKQVEKKYPHTTVEDDDCKHPAADFEWEMQYHVDEDNIQPIDDVLFANDFHFGPNNRLGYGY